MRTGTPRPPRLGEQPSPVVVPVGRSPELRRALQLTEQRLGDEVRFEDLAAEVGYTDQNPDRLLP
jgi:transcriptional regulator GlxA family with amidase domain